MSVAAKSSNYTQSESSCGALRARAAVDAWYENGLAPSTSTVGMLAVLWRVCFNLGHCNLYFLVSPLLCR